MSSSSTLVRCTNVSPGTDPILFYNDVLRSSFSGKVDDIEMVHGAPYGKISAPTSTLYCKMDTLDSARSVFQELQGFKFGQQHLRMPITAVIVPLSEMPGEKALKRLSDFYAEEKAMPYTTTVRFIQVSTVHPKKTILELVDGASINDVDVYGMMYEELPASTFIKNVYVDIDTILVRFSDKGTARTICDHYNGTWYKNNTMYATCVADKQLDDLQVTETNPTTKTAKLFANVKPGTTADEIRKMFAPHVPKDIHMPPGKGFAFVSMHDEAAAKFMAAYPHGKKFDGKFYRVSYAKDDKSQRPGKGKFQPAFSSTKTSPVVNRAPAPVAAPRLGPPKVRVNGLAYATTEAHIRKLFEDAKFEVCEIELNSSIASDIHAVVKLKDYDEVERAFAALDKNKVLKRKIAVVKMA